MDPGSGRETPDTRLRELVAKLSLERKVRLLTGADFWALHSEPTVGLRQIVLSDGPAGVRGEKWDERDPSANVPCPASLAASWDEERVQRIGRLLAGEASRKGVDVVLGPTVNIQRTPYGGRNFEYFSEDPLLTGRIGAAFIRGIQAGGVGATAKHFVANDSETERYGVDVRIDERTLRENYLRPFEDIVREASPWAVMAAYNSVNGTTMTEHPLVRDVLKDEWGFDGVVVSDWTAARTTAASANAGLDLVMPGPIGPWGAALFDAVKSGEVREATVDEKVLRLLRLACRVGALEGVASSASREVAWPDPAVAAELRAAAAAGFVLARNEGGLLPLDPATLRRVAVLGPNAAVGRTLGGGSATVFPPYAVSPLDGLRAALATTVELDYGPGTSIGSRLPPVSDEALLLPDGTAPGLEVRFLDADGSVRGVERRRRAAIHWFGTFAPGLPIAEISTIELRTRLRVSEDGTYLLGVSGVGAFRLTVDQEVVLEAELDPSAGADPAEIFFRPPQRSVPVELRAGEDITVEVRLAPGPRSASTAAPVYGLTMQLNLAARTSDAAELDRAVQLAAAADVAIVIVGTTPEIESEGFDRVSLALPGHQDELVRRVAAANPRTVVVVNAGAPVLLPWIDEVGAVLLTWFPGQEFGNALADVLLGGVEPGGRLPMTWPIDESGPLPSPRPVDGRLPYAESLHIGYRGYAQAGIEPRYWFGHGLGYTSWEYVSLQAPAWIRDGDDLALRVEVRNVGSRRGTEVVQVYLSRPHSSIERPLRWLAGFARVEAAPGEIAFAQVTVRSRAFADWSADRGWGIEPGIFRLAVGGSCAELPLAVDLEVLGQETAPRAGALARP